MQRTPLAKLINKDHKVLWLIFGLLTLVSAIQYFQYFIAYNGSYAFPWKWNLGLTFGTFYTYFLFVPGIFWLNGRLGDRGLKAGRALVTHLFTALAVSAAHLLLIQLIEWAQVRHFADYTFSSAYRWKLAGYLHLELLAYAFITGTWHGVRLLRWRLVSKGLPTGEAEPGRQILERIKVKNGTETSYINVSDIRWIEAYDNYIKCYLKDRFVLVRATMAGTEKLLDAEQFQRIHRSCIVALKEVSAVRSSGGKYEVLLHNDTVLNLSRSYKSVLESRIAAG